MSSPINNNNNNLDPHLQATPAPRPAGGAKSCGSLYDDPCERIRNYSGWEDRGDLLNCFKGQFSNDKEGLKSFLEEHFQHPQSESEMRAIGIVMRALYKIGENETLADFLDSLPQLQVPMKIRIATNPHCPGETQVWGRHPDGRTVLCESTWGAESVLFASRKSTRENDEFAPYGKLVILAG